MARRGRHRSEAQKAVSARLCSELALLGTLLLHAMLFYAFRGSTAPDVRIAPRNAPECVWVSPAASQTWEKEIYAWCLLADPTLLSLPDERYGFARVRRGERVLPHRSTPAFEVPDETEETAAFPPLRLSPPALDVANALANRWPAAELPALEPPRLARLPEGVLWRFPDGTVLSGVPELDMDEVVAALREGPLPTCPTGIGLARAEAGPTVGLGQTGAPGRVRVLQQCSNQRLDDLLVRTLRRALARLDQDSATVATGKDASCFPTPGGSIAFEVEWRLVRVPPETPAPDTE